MEFEMDGESESDSMNDIAKVLKAARIPLTFGIDPEADPEEGPVEQNIIIKNPTNGKPIYISSEWYNTADEPEYMIGGPGVYGTMLEPYDDTVTKLEVIDLIKDLYKRDEVTESMKPTSKTTKKRLTAQIKEMILAEMDSSEMNDGNKTPTNPGVPNDSTDMALDMMKKGIPEAKKKSKKDEEAPEEAPEEMDAELDSEVDTEIPMDTPEPSHTDVQKELTDALEAAKASGDEKLVRQIGNALTYFTRSQVAGEEGNMSGLNESFIKKMQRTAGIIK
jgi:hypothetical protein